MKIGIHLHKKEGSLIESYKYEVCRAKKYKLEIDTIQFFVHNPMNGEKTITEEEIKWLNSEEMKNIKKYIHQAYVYPLNGKKPFTKGIVEELKIADETGANYVIHIPNKTIEEIIELLGRVFKYYKPECIINLEHKVSKTYQYTKIRELIKLTKEIIEKYKEINIGICIDTCHMYANGIDVKDPIPYIKEIMNMGSEKIKDIVVHLNDSEDKIGSNKDRHAILGTNIWNNPKDIRNIIEWLNKNEISIILERKTKLIIKDYKFITE